MMGSGRPSISSPTRTVTYHQARHTPLSSSLAWASRHGRSWNIRFWSTRTALPPCLAKISGLNYDAYPRWQSEASVPLNPPMRLPARISKYELVEYLGGGMAHVYRAQDTVLGRTVALKILTESGTKDRELRSRFLEEARTASNISQDNIISVFDFGEEKGRPFMVME